MTEIWRSCSDFPHYEVSSHGRVRRAVEVRGKPCEILKHWGTISDLYPKVGLRKDGKTYHVLIARLVAKEFLGLKPHETVDFRNSDSRDPSLENLRVCRFDQAVLNNRGHAEVTSKFKGVSWNKDRGLWYACIKPAGERTKSLGRYSSELEAARAYDAAARHYSKEFAYLNFPAEA